jgi:hypothetical protein
MERAEWPGVRWWRRLLAFRRVSWLPRCGTPDRPRLERTAAGALGERGSRRRSALAGIGPPLQDGKGRRSRPETASSGRRMGRVRRNYPPM